MNRPEHLQRFEQAFGSSNPEKELYKLAVSLRDEGISQIELYMLFEHFQITEPAEHPAYDAIGDTMEVIYGGPWAKGRGLFPTALSEDIIKEYRKMSKTE